MPPHARHHRWTSPLWLNAMLLVWVLGSAGCTRLRLPAIDPTGSCLFAPPGTTTTLALPGTGGTPGCLDAGRNLVAGLAEKHRQKMDRLGSCLTTSPLAFPQPAFTTPADPPPCLNPATVPGIPAATEPCVPSAACAGDCLQGPRAVLLGSEICGNPSCTGNCFGGNCLAGNGLGGKLLGKNKMPDRGKRGCILLTPQRVVAPVGGEVLLLSGICGTDGYLQMNEKLEWMVSPDSVGNIIDVGDDDPGLVGNLAGSKVRPRKQDPSYAIGVTSTKQALITRGNTNPADDVALEKGQTWISLSSPSEGVSHVTVLAPESECWDQRKATATIYWVDARWTFPPSQIVPAGTPVTLTTKVLRADGGIPAAGWTVRYEIMDDRLATFDGTGGSNIVEAKVDDSGDATVTLLPSAGARGTTPVNIQIVRPGGTQDNMPALTLGQGQTFVTWSAPALRLRAAGPETATYDQPFEVAADLSNPGDQAATNVRVEVAIPAGVRVNGVSPDAIVVEASPTAPGRVTWELRDPLPAQTALDLFLNLSATSPLSLDFVARADGLSADANVRVDIFQPSIALEVTPVQASVQAGQPAEFRLLVRNTGTRPLRNLQFEATGDPNMIHEDGDTTVTAALADNVDPGATFEDSVTFVPTSSGRRCIQVRAFADGGQVATDTACVTAINPIPKVPRLKVELAPLPATVVGAPPRFYGFDVTNEGDAEAGDVTVRFSFDRQLQVVQGTEGGELSPLENEIRWRIPSLAPGARASFDVELRPSLPAVGARVSASASSPDGGDSSDSIRFDITTTASPSDRDDPLDLGPSLPSPRIPGGPAPAPLEGAPAPLEGAPPLPGDTPPPVTRSGLLRTSVFLADNPVRVGDPIRYRVRVENDSNIDDGQIELQFDLPDGVSVQRITEMTNPGAGGWDRNAGRISLPVIPRLQAGQSIDFVIVLRSSLPQAFDFNLQTRSNNFPDGSTQSVRTEVQ